MSQPAPARAAGLRLGLRANLAQFCLLVGVNALVGGMVGQERSLLSLLATQVFGLAAVSAALTYIVAFGLTKAATNFLAGTLAALREHGRTAEGTVTSEDPVAAVAASVADGDAQEVVVVNRPRFVEDTLHRDWASRLREAVGVPVLHVYGGTTSVG